MSGPHEVSGRELHVNTTETALTSLTQILAGEVHNYTLRFLLVSLKNPKFSIGKCTSETVVNVYMIFDWQQCRCLFFVYGISRQIVGDL